ncbi:MAG: hypothetical protein CFH25_00691, partial [Alphaproteobacteria bacterium MarineAlpha6_Bin3]
KEMINQIKRGDNIITSGGIYCKVSKVIDENKVEVEISNGVKVVISRPTITNVINSATEKDNK